MKDEKGYYYKRFTGERQGVTKENGSFVFKFFEVLEKSPHLFLGN